MVPTPLWFTKSMNSGMVVPSPDAHLGEGGGVWK